jgi:hypothetical protein
MLVHRLITLGTLALGTLWAACLVGTGLYALAHAGVAATLWWTGVAGVLAGNFVFMEVVADRLFPNVRRRTIDLVELAVGLAMMSSIAVAGFQWLSRSGA